MMVCALHALLVPVCLWAAGGPIGPGDGGKRNEPAVKTSSSPATEPSAPAEKTDTSKVSEISRGVIRVLVHTDGTVRAEDVFRLHSTIEGRVEQIDVSSFTWVRRNRPLLHVLPKEMAAIMDTKAPTPGQIIEERWERYYKPKPVDCASECFILKIFAREKTWVQPQTLLVEAARKLRLIGRIRPGESQWIKKGQLITFWAKAAPKERHQSRVDSFKLDIQGQRVDPGGTLTVLLNRGRYLDPGTEWEGYVTAVEKRDALRVPTGALIIHDGQAFLPIRVSTGITTREITEIVSGLPDHAKVLQFPASVPECADRHGVKPQVLSELPSPPPPPAAECRCPELRCPSRREEGVEPRMRDPEPDEEEMPRDIEERYPSDLE
ncbi:MAG: hypothetical protein WC728_16500 [Elusimicrobiota bacterium]